MELNNNIVSYDGNEYKLIPQENGDILLSKINIIHITSIDDIKKYNFSNSNITKCILNNKCIEKYKYKTILNNVYELINNGVNIIKNTTLNIDTRARNNNGYYYLENLGISVQGVDANKCLYEIIHQCTNNNINIILNITLNDGKQIKIQI